MQRSTAALATFNPRTFRRASIDAIERDDKIRKSVALSDTGLLELDKSRKQEYLILNQV